MAVRRKPEGDTTHSAVHKKLLGEEIKKLRERRIQTGPDIARVLEVSAPTYSRAERGQGTFAIRDLRRILEHLGKIEPIPQEKLDELIELQRLANQRGRYGKYFAYVQPATKRYAELEWGAARITDLADSFICGLLQTDDYVSAIMSKTLEGDLQQRFTRFRLARQEILTRDNAPEIRIFQSEAALLFKVGGPQVMREQLRHLLEVAELPNLSLHIIPFEGGAPFKQITMLEFDGGAAPVLVSSAFGAVHTVDNRTQAQLAMGNLKLAAEKAVPAEESSAIIRNILDSM